MKQNLCELQTLVNFKPFGCSAQKSPNMDATLTTTPPFPPLSLPIVLDYYAWVQLVSSAQDRFKFSNLLKRSLKTLIETLGCTYSMARLVPCKTPVRFMSIHSLQPSFSPITPEIFMIRYNFNLFKIEGLRKTKASMTMMYNIVLSFKQTANCLIC